MVSVGAPVSAAPETAVYFEAQTQAGGRGARSASAAPAPRVYGAWSCYMWARANTEN